VRDPAQAIEEDHWISWEEKPDFYTSGPHDRHYVINHVKVEIHFGDGHHGMIPPLGKKNIRMAYYQSGGGVAGNQPIGSIVNLITTIPYVKSVINNSPATGGADQESLPALMERVPRSLRHQRRAVTLEDYEDLAKEASTEVARAKCIQKAPGSLSLMIVPRLADQEPKPAPELKAQIRAFLTSYSDPCVSLEITESEYINVVVSAVITVVPSLESSRIEQTIAMRIAQFLHPLTGGFNSLGWEFNRIPYLSDFYRLLETMTEVDHVDSLKIEKPPNPPKLFLISSGDHSVQIKRDAP
jgi:predicted phage baseplate assembly protein